MSRLLAFFASSALLVSTQTAFAHDPDAQPEPSEDAIRSAHEEPEPEPSPRVREGRVSGLFVGGWVVAGIGVTSLVASAVTYSLYSDHVEDGLACAGRRDCDLDGLNDELSVLRGANIATFVLGVAGVGGGAAMVLTDVFSSREEAAVDVAFGVGSVWVSGRF
ncbi:MAG: hypothetical protein HOW73_44540 [Polyangiaceae bacterium]|nr:hypothetical protein [Polyangiaceae bacterium]